ncbi:MAG: DUF7507 domain-containing protein [Clostridium sp.]
MGLIYPFNIRQINLKALNTNAVNSVTNVGFLNYQYSPTSTTVVNGSTLTNPVNTIIIDDNTTIEKYVDKNIIQTGQTVTYTIIVTNNDPYNVVSNIVFVDTIPPTTTFVSNSFIVNSIQYPSQNPENGVNLGINLNPGQSATITFQVVGNGTDGGFTNSGSINYTMSLFGQSVTGVQQSNLVNTIYRNLIFNIKKYVDKQYADIGDIINYTLVVTNTGNVDLDNTIITDTIPVGTQFVANSVNINGTPSSSNPEIGIPTGVIPKYTVSTITFQVIVI